MISSYSCVGAIAAIRDRWNVLHSRSRKATQLGVSPNEVPVSTVNPYGLCDPYQPQEILKNNLYEVLLREQVSASAKVNAQREAKPVDPVVRRSAEHASVAPAGEQWPLVTELAEKLSFPDEPDPTPSRPIEEDKKTTVVQPAPNIKPTITAEPEALPSVEPQRPMQYTPGGRAIPVIPNSKDKPLSHPKPPHPLHVAKRSDGKNRSGWEHYTRMTPLPPYKTQPRRQVRSSRSKLSSMASTPISEDDETALHPSENFSDHSQRAEHQDKSPQSDQPESIATDSSASTSSASTASDASLDSNKAKSKSRVEYIEDTQLLSTRRQQLKREQRFSQPVPGAAGASRYHQTRGFTYPPAGIYDSYASQSHQGYNGYPPTIPVRRYVQRPASFSHHSSGSTRRISSTQSLHQRTMLSQWRANMVVAATQQAQHPVAGSPWTAPGSESVAASDALASPPTMDPWRARRTQNGCAGWGTRGEARILSGMDAREIEVAHREVLRRMQAGANRRLEVSEACSVRA